jgi:hypothetical protein
MGRPTHWRRGAGDITIVDPSFAYFTTNAIMNDGETVVRIRWHYTIVASSPGGTLTAMWHPGAHGLVVYDHSLLVPPEVFDAPLLNPENYQGEPWLWWESWSYEHWNPVSSDPRWVGPSDRLARDTHAQRILDFGLVPNNYAASWMWQIRDDIDWAIVNGSVAYSILVMDAPP